MAEAGAAQAGEMMQVSISLGLSPSALVVQRSVQTSDLPDVQQVATCATCCNLLHMLQLGLE